MRREGRPAPCMAVGCGGSVETRKEQRWNGEEGAVGEHTRAVAEDVSVLFSARRLRASESVGACTCGREFFSCSRRRHCPVLSRPTNHRMPPRCVFSSRKQTLLLPRSFAIAAHPPTHCHGRTRLHAHPSGGRLLLSSSPSKPPPSPLLHGNTRRCWQAAPHTRVHDRALGECMQTWIDSMKDGAPSSTDVMRDGVRHGVRVQSFRRERMSGHVLCFRFFWGFLARYIGGGLCVVGVCWRRRLVVVVSLLLP